MESDR